MCQLHGIPRREASTAVGPGPSRPTREAAAAGVGSSEGGWEHRRGGKSTEAEEQRVSDIGSRDERGDTRATQKLGSGFFSFDRNW